MLIVKGMVAVRVDTIKIFLKVEASDTRVEIDTQVANQFILIKHEVVLLSTKQCMPLLE